MAKVTRAFLLYSIVFSIFIEGRAQTDDNYSQVVKERAHKIVATLGIADSTKFYRVRDKIAQEYIEIKNLDESKVTAMTALKAKGLDKAAAGVESKRITELSDANRAKLNKKFVQSLEKDLNTKQVEGVKDGLTYNVLPLTYKAHLEMIPSLKPDEKKYIYNALLEARERAMAEGSSNAKHAWFGKYKGRINNYLASRGYDLKKEREAWSARIQAQKK